MARWLWGCLFCWWLAGCTVAVAEERPAVAGNLATPAMELAAEAGPSITPQPSATPSPVLPAATPIPPLPPPARLPAGIKTTPLPSPPAPAIRRRLIGFSSLGHAIEGFTLGEGPVRLLFVGGLHGGYEWNTILLAYQLLDYFAGNLQEIPSTVSLTIIPSANPDGQLAVTGTRGRFTAAQVAADTLPGRFNARGVDLNRNWDCQWQANATWRRESVSGGGEPFSEVESLYLRDFILGEQPALVVFWHSALPAVILGGCQGLVLPETRTLGALYAAASGYPLAEGLAAYEVTGSASGYLALAGVPALAVELRNHSESDWAENLAAVQALLRTYGSTP